ncbi:DDE-type integrase/transposase/recombinase [Fastidiosibacter lacustris]|uniref:DDE-type integrase/transposase/recombinase n=1 Tax=Fastidiosibacter lacustris TaxID=2056695 RepID=UPI000E356581|nr:DDE-type integrase/transposase/recombinase [Fastidiosibacter lacustris]
MAKSLPTEQLIILHNKMSMYAARDPKRKQLVCDFANSFGVSESTVRRQLREHIHFSKVSRLDKNTPRVISKSDMLLYCRVIAALKLRTSNKKNKHLSTQQCIKILENYGVETAEGFVISSKGLLKKTTINRYLKNWGYDPTSMKVEPAVVRFEAENSNDCWQFDFTPSDLKKISANSSKKLFIANVTDDKSGMLYYEYVESDGEDVLTALKFLFNAMSAKKIEGMPFQGIPKMIYTDNGAFAKSALFKRVLDALGIQLKKHLPKNKDGRRTTARAKGKVERTNRTIKESFEPLFHLHQPESLEQANLWATNYLRQYNQSSHRSEDCSRIKAWSKFLPAEGYREMCSWEKFCQIVRDPELRRVASDGCVSVNGVKYQLSTEMAGLEVTLLHGMFDNELHVEFNSETHGPFYPFSGPIPLHTYRSPPKSKREKTADEIASLAETLSVPISVMSNSKDDSILKSLEASHVTDCQITSIPFREDKKTTFQNRLEAKKAIAKYLNRPLAELRDEQLDHINMLVQESLNKEFLLSKVKQYFSLSIAQLE